MVKIRTFHEPRLAPAINRIPLPTPHLRHSCPYRHSCGGRPLCNCGPSRFRHTRACRGYLAVFCTVVALTARSTHHRNTRLFTPLPAPALLRRPRQLTPPPAKIELMSHGNRTANDHSHNRLGNASNLRPSETNHPFFSPRPEKKSPLSTPVTDPAVTPNPTKQRTSERSPDFLADITTIHDLPTLSTPTTRPP